jgi:zinc protease
MTMRTKRLFSIALILALAGAAAAQQPAAQASAKKPVAAASRKPAVSGYKSLKYPPLHQIKVPEPVRFEMPNGMVVYLVENHELPLVSMRAMIRTGSRWEPADKVGLASITGTVMRTGGSVTRNGDKLDEELDRLGASVETSIGQDSGGASVSVLKEDMDKGLDILADILEHPAFPQDKIDLAKIAERDAIARRNDNPNGIVFRELTRVIFGKDSPYARETEYDTINSITRDDLVAFHKRFFQPENIILGAWGDFDAATMRAKIEKTLGAWPRGGQPKPPVPEVDPAARNRAGVYAINKDDMEQSWVVMGALGGKRDDPDYCPLQVMNQILGGGFASRLFSNVRTDQGLAYAVFSSWGASWDRPGMFIAGGSSKPATTVKIYHSIRQQLERLAQGGATPDELARSKDDILKGMAFDFDSTGKIVNRTMTYEYFGYPKDYLQQYRAGIEKVSQADVARVAREYLKPDQFAVLFLGKESGYEAPLASLGKVTPIDITIPSPKQQELAAATPESIAKGKALLEAARKAMGGAALMAVKDYTVSGTATVSTPQGDIPLQVETTFSLSGKMLNKMTTPMGDMVQAYDGTVGWMSAGGQTREIPASQSGDFTNGLFRNSISLLQHFEDAGYTVQALGQVEVDGKPAEGVAVSDPARKLQCKVYIDPATGLIVRKDFTASVMGPPAASEEVYSDYRDADGVKIPYKTVLSQGGKKKIDQDVANVKINPGVADTAYQKPAN